LKKKKEKTLLLTRESLFLHLRVLETQLKVSLMEAGALVGVVAVGAVAAIPNVVFQ